MPGVWVRAAWAEALVYPEAQTGGALVLQRVEDCRENRLTCIPGGVAGTIANR